MGFAEEKSIPFRSFQITENDIITDIVTIIALEET